MRYGAEREQERSMTERSMTTSVLTDIQFWVPVVVLIAGLILLVAIR